MTEAVAESGAMSPEVQIKCAVEEGMGNIARAIFGENLSFVTKYNFSKITVNGLGMAHAQASAVTSSGRSLVIKADVPIRFPDLEDGGYRIDDATLWVEVNDWAKTCQFEAWCEHNPYNGAKVIVRQVYPDFRERWLVADSMEGEVLYRGPFESLFPWAKEVVAEKWSHLPHVSIDTEVRAVIFISRRQ